MPPSTPNPLSPTPLNQIVYKKSDLEDPSLTLFNQDLTNIKKALNSVMGFSGPIRLSNHIDLQGNRITNLGAAESETDAVSQLFGNDNYGPDAIQPQLDALGKKVLQSARRINDTTQREDYSTFLNGLLNTAPTSNTSLVTFGSPAGGSVSLTISAGVHQRVDGSVVPYAAYNDTVTLPTSYAITSLTRTGGVVTAVTAANPFIAGETVAIFGAGDSSFDGSFYITTIVSGTSFKYNQTAPDASTTGGTVSLGGVYYYYIERGTNVLARSGPFTADTWSNRTNASMDGKTIIAVVVVNASGGDTTNSAAGATPPAANNGAGVRLFGRL